MANYTGKNNLIGKTFGNLQVIDYYGQGKWLCNCICGTQIVVRGYTLKDGRTKSCGCLKTRNMGPRKDITGQRFGNLVALEYVKGGKWRCLCDCGNHTTVDTRNLNSGHTTSCGCKTKDNGKSRQIDMSNFENENFKVLRYAKPDSQGTAMWETLCKHCGKTFVVRGSNLRNQAIRSCGCLHSRNEKYIADLLDNANIPYAKEYTFSDLKGSGGGRLRFDFAVFKDNGELSHLIEYQGEQHYRKVEGKWGENYEILLDHDKRKVEYCKTHNIDLRIISYLDDYSLEDLI